MGKGSLVGGPRLAMFGFIVEDMARSLAFYRKLGMEFPEGSDEKDGLVIPIGGGLQMFWSTVFAARNDPGVETAQRWLPNVDRILRRKSRRG